MEARAEYLDQMQKLIQKAPEELGQDVVALLSVPQLTVLTPEYLAAPIKIMVMGQETYNEEVPLSSLYDENGTHTDSAFAAFLADYQVRFEHFDFGSGYEHLPFWKAWSDVCRLFGLSSNRSIVWSNLSKVQLLYPYRNSMSVAKLPSHQATPVTRWQKHLARAEMRYVKPDVVLMFAGDNIWMAEHMYGDKGFFSPRQVSFQQVGDLPKSTRQVLIPDHPEIAAFTTYHPNVRPKYRQKALAEREVLFEALRMHLAGFEAQ